MPIWVTCKNRMCGRTFSVEDHLGGTTVKCPSCDQPCAVRLKMPRSVQPEPPVVKFSPPPPEAPFASQVPTPRVERLPSRVLRWAAGLVVTLAILAGLTVGVLTWLKHQRAKQVGEATAGALAVQPAAPKAPVPQKEPLSLPAPKAAETAPTAVPAPTAVFDPLEYARDIAPINEHIDRFEYPPAKEKTQALAAKYEPTREGKFLIKQKIQNIDTLVALRRGAFERVNSGTVKVAMKDIAPQFEGEVARADEEHLTIAQDKKKVEYSWTSLSKNDVYMFYARSGAENDAAGHVSLAVYLMEGKFVAEFIAKSEKELDVAQRRGVNVADLRWYVELLRRIQAAVDKTQVAAAKASEPAQAPAPPPKKEEAPKVAELPKPPQKEVRIVAPPEMVLVPAGEFIQGDASMRDAQPQRKVYLDAFFIDKTEVTNAQYLKFCKATGHRYPKHWKEGRIPQGRENHPVVNVTWDDAVAYATWAGKRLPTEAEWEKAARGTDGRRFPWGNTWNASLCNSGHQQAKYGFNPGPEGKGWFKVWQKWLENPSVKALVELGGCTVPVGSYPKGASPYGCLDMSGNVAEWCADFYDEMYYRMAPDRNPTGPAGGFARVTRGGSWVAYSEVVSCPYRGYTRLEDANVYIGFRCAKDAK